MEMFGLIKEQNLVIFLYVDQKILLTVQKTILITLTLRKRQDDLWFNFKDLYGL